MRKYIKTKIIASEMSIPQPEPPVAAVLLPDDAVPSAKAANDAAEVTAAADHTPRAALNILFKFIKFSPV